MIAICLTILITTIVPAVAGDFTLTRDWHIYPLLEELELRGRIGILPGVKPYTVDEAKNWISKDTLSATQWGWWVDHTLQPIVDSGCWFLLEPAVWGRKKESERKASSFGAVRTGLGMATGRWSIYGGYRVDSGLYSDPDYYGMRWQRIAGKADQSYLLWNGGSVVFQAGRDYTWFGQGLALSGIYPYERFFGKFRIGKHIEMVWSMAQLDKYFEMRDTTKDVFSRYLAMHRIQLTFENIQLAFSEMVLYGGMGRNWEIYYMLPLYALHGEQMNHGLNDNALWSAQAKILFPPAKIELEGIVDDFQIENITPSDREPPEIGASGKFTVAIAEKLFFISASFSGECVTGWTYNQNLPYNRFLMDGKPLGSQDGNDYWKTGVGTRIIGPGLGCELFAYIKYKGECNIDDQWTEPWLNPEWKFKFPSGVVEKQTGFSFDLWTGILPIAKWNLRGTTELSLSGYWEKVNNLDHIEGKKGNRWGIVWRICGQFGKGWKL